MISGSAADSLVEDDTRFWTLHLRVGFAAYTFVSLGVAAYAAATPDGANRVALLITAATCAVGGAIVTKYASYFGSRTWSARFTFLWSLSGGMIVTTLALLDGAIDSPLLLMTVLPVVYAGMALDPVPTLVCGLAAFSEVLVARLLDSHIELGPGAIVVDLVILATSTALGVMASINRSWFRGRQRQMLEQLAELATVDGLTGCLNRRSFGDRLCTEIKMASREEWPLALLLIDVDNFKSVNDTYGHARGDAVLALLGAALREVGRKTDVAARLGGDEFAVLLPDCPAVGARAWAERLRTRVATDSDQLVSLSVGIAMLDLDRPDAEALQASADRSLYLVKATGRNGVAMYEPQDGQPRRCDLRRSA